MDQGQAPQGQAPQGSQNNYLTRGEMDSIKLNEADYNLLKTAGLKITISRGVRWIIYLIQTQYGHAVSK